jgi:hypothetical protein
MRPGQNKRLRGRNNNRKGPNPLTRSYESNGPDVKIRGTAHHVAEKYLQLARDAQSSGDPVMAENYLQHAEHYFRLIAAAQTAQLQSQQGYVRAAGEPEIEDEEDDDDFGGLPDRFASPAERFQPQNFAPPPQPYNQQQQPYQERQPYFGNGQERQSQDRQPMLDRPMQDRGPRQDRPYHDRQGQNRDPRGNRDQRPQRMDRNDQPRLDRNDQPRFDRNEQPRIERQEQPRIEPARIEQPRIEPIRMEQPRLDRIEPPRAVIAPEQPEVDIAPSLPAFITAPVRINGNGNGNAEAEVQKPAASAPSEAAAPEANGETGRFPLRRRRRTRAAFPAEGETVAAGEPVGKPAGDTPAGE